MKHHPQLTHTHLHTPREFECIRGAHINAESASSNMETHTLLRTNERMECHHKQPFVEEFAQNVWRVYKRMDEWVSEWVSESVGVQLNRNDSSYIYVVNPTNTRYFPANYNIQCESHKILFQSIDMGFGSVICTVDDELSSGSCTYIEISRNVMASSWW